jgi:integrase
MATANLTGAAEWVKPYPGFPLNRHPNGQLCKRINGHLRYFGKSEDWQAALRPFNRAAPYWFAGQTPPPEPMAVPGVVGVVATTTHLPSPGPTLDEVGNRFLDRELKRHERGQICLESYLDTRRAIVAMFEFLGREKPALSLRPDDWAGLRHHLETEPDPDDPDKRRRGAYALDRTICYIRAMRTWAEENVLQPGQVIRMGDGFDRVRISEKRKDRRARRMANGDRFFTRDEVHKILDALKDLPVLKAMFLLALNGGLGATDLSAMPVGVLDLDDAVLDYDRVKTGVARTVTLWPQTVEALRAAIPLRPKLKPGYESHVFLTRCGVPFCRSSAADDADAPKKATRADAVAGEFGKVLKGLGIKRPGLNFYACRSTFRTHAGALPDREAVDWVMGHAIEGSTEWYVKPPLERLRAVTNHVENVLFS